MKPWIPIGKKPFFHQNPIGSVVEPPKFRERNSLTLSLPGRRKAFEIIEIERYSRIYADESWQKKKLLKSLFL